MHSLLYPPPRRESRRERRERAERLSGYAAPQPKRCCPSLPLQVEPQALQHDREERFNLPLFRRTGELGLLGVTAPEEYGGSGMDATGVCAQTSQGLTS